MTLVAITPDYTGEIKDRVEQYRGQMLIAVGWDEHLCYPPLCFPVSPDMPFKTLTTEVLTGMYAQHPDAVKIDWNRVEWMNSSQPFQPDPEKSLKDNGIGHKSALRFRTPGLTGYAGMGI